MLMMVIFPPFEAGRSLGPDPVWAPLWLPPPAPSIAEPEDRGWQPFVNFPILFAELALTAIFMGIGRMLIGRQHDSS